MSAAVSAAAVIALVPLSQSATAAPDEAASVVCQGGSLNVKFNPGLEALVKKEVELGGSGDLGTCSSAARPDITGGTFQIVGGPFRSTSCETDGVRGRGEAFVDITWNDGTVDKSERWMLYIDGRSLFLEGMTFSDLFSGGTRANGKITDEDWHKQARGCFFDGLTNYDTPIDQFSINAPNS
ncbi:hypothetical protein ACGFSB_02935 [Streptomyces sp. NPDC048441]|uniref:hypothetical protein n=1 Tax=Streptomyces sp. NPDC048441 TaxID=3365552 RepID=UPI0037239195